MTTKASRRSWAILGSVAWLLAATALVLGTHAGVRAETRVAETHNDPAPPSWQIVPASGPNNPASGASNSL